MKVVVGSDHAGVDLKRVVSEDLVQRGHDVLDVGTYSHEGVDYPDFAAKVAHAILNGEAERGVLICGSGIGASVAANKIDGIRAGLAHDFYSAHQGVEHDNMNILVFGARIIGEETAKELSHAFLNAAFTGEERHVRRLAKIAELERTHGV